MLIYWLNKTFTEGIYGKMLGFVVEYENLVWTLTHNLRENSSLVSNVITVYTTYVPKVIGYYMQVLKHLMCN